MKTKKHKTNTLPLKDLLIVFLSVLSLDQLTKWLIIWKVPKYTSIKVLPFFDICHVYNFGISFGMLQSHGKLAVWVFAFIAIALCLWLVRMIILSTSRIEQLSCMAIIAGALSNVADRFMHGAVVDFLSFHMGAYHWPAFNVADSAIVCCVILILMNNVWHPNGMKNKK